MAMRNYARASIELEGGDLYSIFDVSIKETNAGKIEHTFKKEGSGASFGPVEVEMTMQIKIATTAPERNWRSYVRDKRLVQATFKYPDGTKDVLDGIFTDRDGKQGLEGAFETTMTFKGVASNPAV